jgi:hypothetical protein
VGKDTLVTTRHEFLQQLHELIQPKTYLEVGVQHGWSLQLSKAELSIGIDPVLLPGARKLANHDVILWDRTSDAFFEDPYVYGDPFPIIDLAFIDGMHLVEFALRDFANIERRTNERSVIVFDDVLPTTREMAAREQCPGDWTGDVWRVYDILRERRPDLVLVLVDTQPTGLLVVLKPDPVMGPVIMDAHERRWCEPGQHYATFGQIDLHQAVLDRRYALDADLAFEQIARWRNR